MRMRAARDFNTSIVKPLVQVFGANALGRNLTVTDYSFTLCRAGEGIPNPYGNRGCGQVGTVDGVGGRRGAQGALVGTTAAPVCCQPGCDRRRGVSFTGANECETVYDSTKKQYCHRSFALFSHRNYEFLIEEVCGKIMLSTYERDPRRW